MHILAQSDENNVADAVSAIVKFKSVSNHECQSYRFFRGSDLRIEAVQSFGRNIQECSQRCSPSLLQWEQILWLWPNPWSTAIQRSWLWSLTSEDSVSWTRQQFKHCYCWNLSLVHSWQNLSWPDSSSWDVRWTGSCVLETVGPVRFACYQTLLVLSLVWSGACAPSECASWLCYSW